MRRVCKYMVFENTGGFSMKKKYLYIVLAIYAIAAFELAACASSSKPEAAPATAVPTQQPATAAANNVSDDPIKSRIIDWQGRTAKSPSTPDWITQVALLNYNQAAIHLGYDDAMQAGGPIYRGWAITGPDERGAEMMADMALARTVAKELQTQVNNYVAQSSTMTEATKNTIKENTETRTNVTLTGYRQVGSFWQLVENDDSTTKRKTRVTVLYRLYQFDNQAWRAITAAYVQEVLDKLPTPLDQREVQDMLTNALQNARKGEELTIDQRKKQIEYEDWMLREQTNTGIANNEAAQRQAGQQALAQIAADRDVALAKEGTARTEARADARVQSAYADPITARAATVTPSDAQMIEAARIASRILF
jgi:hypothetical protein